MGKFYLLSAFMFRVDAPTYCKMYFRTIRLENTGSISDLNLNFPFDNNQPKPVILIGKNGSGKTILLSYLVNFLISTKQLFYENTEVEQGKVFKIRTPQYIQHGKDYYCAFIKLGDNIKHEEWILRCPKKEFEDKLKYAIADEKWNTIQDDSNDLLYFSYQNNISQKKNLKQFVDRKALVYFPANRYEDPAWLNFPNLNHQASVAFLQKRQGVSDRNILCTNTLRTLTNWIYDVVFDSQVFERQQIDLSKITGVINNSQILFALTDGVNNRILNLITEILRIIFCQNNNQYAQVFVNRKHQRSIGVNIIEGTEIIKVIPNIFFLSSGESLIITLFLSLVRDYDLTGNSISSSHDVNGIAIIDEIDLHLNTDLQFRVLPTLIAKFPNVQFIATSHAPLFLLGLEQTLGENGFDLIDMPSGQKTTVEAFSEFKNAFQYFQNTKAFNYTVEQQILSSNKPKILTEGETDPIYLRKACELLGYQNLIGKVDIEWIGINQNKGKPLFTGKDSLTKTRQFLIANPSFLKHKTILLYDCDTQKAEQDLGKLYEITIKQNLQNKKVKGGIENLFSENLFEDKFYTKKTKISDYGEETIISTFQKMDFCNWVCHERSNPDDFINFKEVIDMINNLLAL